jgi:MFS family permease
MAPSESNAAPDAKNKSTRESHPALLPEVERTMRLSIYEGALTTVFLNWISGSVLTGYMQFHGASVMEMALVGSVPALAQSSAPFAAWIQSVYPKPKPLTIALSSIGRGLWLLPALWPLLSLPRESIPFYTILLMVCSFFFQHAGGAVWSAWMGNVVPAARRGRYFGTRNSILGVVGLVGNIAVGLFLDHVPPPLNYQLTFVMGVLLAFAAINLFRFHHVPPMAPAPMDFKEVFTVPLKDPNFRRLLVFVTYWQATVLLAAAFVYPYIQDGHLKMSFTVIALYQAIAAITTLIMGPFWGRVADKVGNKAVLSITTVIAGFFLPMTWILTTPGNPTMLFVSGIVDGIAWSAINPAIFNLSLATAPKQNRIAYLGILSLFTGVSGFLGGVLSAPLLSVFEYTECMIGDFHWTPYHTLFFVSAMMRSMAWILIKPVNETHAWRTRDLIRQAVPTRFVHFFWRA